MDISKVVTSSTNEEFMRQKNVIVGTSRLVDGVIYLSGPNNTIIAHDTKYVPSLFKIVDEILVNSIDHFINCILKSTIQQQCNPHTKSRYVNMIYADINDKGVITVINDGYGIPITRMPNMENKYLPEVLFSKDKTGTNMGNDSTRITGGTNGIGATTITAFSSTIKIITDDGTSNYTQVAKLSGTKGNRTMVFNTPTIVPSKGHQITSVTFLIDWASTEYKTYNRNVKMMFNNFIHKRLMQTSIYVTHVSRIAKELGLLPNTTNTIISYGKNIIDLDLRNSEAIKNTFGLAESFTIEVTCKKKVANVLSGKFMFVVGINEIGSGSGYKEMSIINGVEVLRNPMMDLVKTIVVRNVKIFCSENKMPTGNSKAKNYITLIMVGCIPDPQWVGQVKEGITLNKDFINSYNIKEECDKIKESVSRIIYELVTNDKLKKKVVINRNILRNNRTYQPCLSLNPEGKRYASAKNKRLRLFICEGSSAASLISNILDYKLDYNVHNTGILTSKGVIANVYHKMNWYSNEQFEFAKPEFGEQIKSKIIMTESLEGNEFIQTFLACTNISQEKVSESELFNRLHYDEIICATDSDYDGWNITGLIIVLMSKWPELIINNRLKILHLPIIRIIPDNLEELTKKEKRKNGKITNKFINSIEYMEFYSQREFNDYIAVNTIRNGFIAKYYKGLATTDDAFDAIIARDINKYIYTFNWDKNAARSLELYYGKTRVDVVDGEKIIVKMSDERKRILSKPVTSMSENEMKLYKEFKVITVSTFLRIFVKQYFLDNLKRKLLKIIDGRNNVGTKINYALPFVFGAKNQSHKVDSVGPSIVNISQYHHGVESLNLSVQGSAQEYPGGTMFPILETSGKWGLRYDGGSHEGSDSTGGQSRYIECKLNKRFYSLLYRAEDNCVLLYQEEENKATEPSFMLPVFPIIAVENYNTTAHGWKITMWGRSYDDVYKYIILKIATRSTSTLPCNVEKINNEIGKIKFRMDPRNYDAEPLIYSVTEPDGTTRDFFLSLGGYTTMTLNDSDIIFVNKLPTGVWTKTYVEFIVKRIGTKDKQGPLYNIVKDIRSLSTTEVSVYLYMYEGWKDKIDAIAEKESGNFDHHLDNIQIVLHLYSKLQDNINVIDENGNVLSFDTYNQLIDHWFEVRLMFYTRRIERLRVIRQLKYDFALNKQRYLECFADMNLSGKSEKIFDEILAERGFKRFRKINYKHIKLNLIPTDRLVELATGVVATANNTVVADNVATSDNTAMDDIYNELINTLRTEKIIGNDLSYSYLRMLSTGSTSERGINIMKGKVEKMKNELAKYEGNDIVCKTFRAELIELNNYIKSEFYNC